MSNLWADEKNVIVFTNVMVAAASLKVSGTTPARPLRKFVQIPHVTLPKTMVKPTMTPKPYRKNTSTLKLPDFAFPICLLRLVQLQVSKPWLNAFLWCLQLK